MLRIIIERYLVDMGVGHFLVPLVNGHFQGGAGRLLLGRLLCL